MARPGRDAGMASPAVLALGVAAVGFLLAVLVGPLLAHAWLRDVRDPTAAERNRLDAFGERIDRAVDGVAPDVDSAVGPDVAGGVALDVDRVLVVETDGNSVEVSVRGPPGYRVLFVTDYVLGDLDAVTARALLAAEAGRQAVRYDEYRAAAATVAVVVGVAWFGGLVPYSAGFVALGAVALVLLAVGRRLQYRADAIAADAVGPAELADAFETTARLHGRELDAPGWRGYLEVQPPLWNRIRRLRQRE